MAARYDLISDYAATPQQGGVGSVADPYHVALTPSWALAVIRLGRPLSYSRRTTKSLGTVTEGAFTRTDKPLFIIDDCVDLQIHGAKAQHTKTLSASLRFSEIHYLAEDGILPDDWVLAWMTTSTEDLTRVLDKIQQGQAANEFLDGLRFVGRVHDIRADVSVGPDGAPSTTYALTAIGFNELDTAFYYDMALATAAAVSSDIKTFMAQLGLNFKDWADQNALSAGTVQDNGDRLIVSLVNMILGKGVNAAVNEPVERALAGTTIRDQANNNTIDIPPNILAPQASKEAPAAYLVPRLVGQILGRDPANASKEGIFGYADILETLIGVQRYENAQFDSYPELDLGRSTQSRRYTPIPLKGTFLPVNPTFVNRPLWSILQQFLNPAVNEMYTALRPNPQGRIVPTLVARQIPFSTESAQERQTFPLTRFMGLPRWVLSDTLVYHSSLGRSNATRCNLVHIYGEAAAYSDNKSVTHQLTRNPPIFDQVDIQRSGIRAQMETVNCAIADELAAPRAWMEAIADWRFGSQYTLNGTIECVGLAAPVVEGDNIEFHGQVYHVEAVTHHCQISSSGRSFKTTLQVSNGMPVDQTGATADFPVYPGFTNRTISSTTTTVQGEGSDLYDVDETTTETQTSSDSSFAPAGVGGASLETRYGKYR